jgi:hypothetical protein
MPFSEDQVTVTAATITATVTPLPRPWFSRTSHSKTDWKTVFSPAQ